jgi:hypothetical protein
MRNPSIFVINEITLTRFIVQALSDKCPYILSIEPLIPPLRFILERTVNWALSAGYARWIIDLIPEESALWQYPTRTLLYDIFGKTEDWHNQHFQLEQLDTKLPSYAMAYKLLSCNFAKPKHFNVLLLGKALATKVGKEAHVFGLQKDTQELYIQYWKRGFKNKIRSSWAPKLLPNTAIFILLTFFTLGWIISRIRIFKKVRRFFFAADYLEDRRDFPLYQELSEGGPVLLTVREPSRQTKSYDELKNYEICGPGDGWFSPINALYALKTAGLDCIRLFLICADRAPSLYFQVAALAYRRQQIKALLNRYLPRFYWGRDDYNVEHILRRQELNKLGGTSLGIQHGFPVSAYAYPAWRYISFDRYYVAGLAVYEYCLKDTWANDMEVIPIGTFGATRDDFAQISNHGPKDIVVFTAMAVGEKRLVEFIRDLAKYLPDRRILLQVKINFVDSDAGKEFISACMEGTTNIFLERDTVFNLFRKARYIFSDPSTIISEALKLKLMAFTIDVLPYHETSILRHFNGLCYSSGIEAGQRIKDIESGKWDYPHKEFSSLTDSSDDTWLDIVRRDVGLPAFKAQPNLKSN